MNSAKRLYDYLDKCLVSDRSPKKLYVPSEDELRRYQTENAEFIQQLREDFEWFITHCMPSPFHVLLEQIHKEGLIPRPAYEPHMQAFREVTNGRDMDTELAELEYYNRIRYADMDRVRALIDEYRRANPKGKPAFPDKEYRLVDEEAYNQIFHPDNRHGDPKFLSWVDAFMCGQKVRPEWAEESNTPEEG